MRTGIEWFAIGVIVATVFWLFVRVPCDLQRLNERAIQQQWMEEQR